jgi:hypothetical protein
MSKYDPLKRHLIAATSAELPLSFRNVERILGFPLPPSARKHREWWSNHVGTHVGARAWREAGWKTERVDLAGERLVFVRDSSAARPSADAGFRRLLTPSASRLLEERAEYHHDEDLAIAELLNAAALDRRRRLIDHFAATSPDLRGAAQDSTAIIREDRDGR